MATGELLPSKMRTGVTSKIPGSHAAGGAVLHCLSVLQKARSVWWFGHLHGKEGGGEGGSGRTRLNVFTPGHTLLSIPFVCASVCAFF